MDLWNSIKEGFIPMIGKTVRDVTVPPLIVGDSAFPLRSWLLKPYTNAVLTPQQHYFNYRLSRACMVTEAAYGQLKGREMPSQGSLICLLMKVVERGTGTN
ncbi:unnamed protein product [Pocillopora meandrina]|uniref:DDE Tnp4 domain-containing protein n=1 Tax=Pocillopora meandrina TaxID=46732 RepID=A0AAU9VJI6_9CNID|nr:unnamed protein product [Pocillopora meandrina]